MEHRAAKSGRAPPLLSHRPTAEALPVLWALHRAVGAQVSLLRPVAGL